MTSAEQDLESHSPREQLIRDLHAICEFYIANPDHPLPSSIALTHLVPTKVAVESVAAIWCDGKSYVDGTQCWHELHSINGWRTRRLVQFIITQRPEEENQ